jgi:uncharacterized protein
MTDHKAIVSEMYEAFGRGDIQAIVEQLGDDVAWEQWNGETAHLADVPWLAPRSKAEVVGFFEIIGTWTMLNLQVLDLMVGERQVSAQCVIDARLPNGGTIRDEEMHLWTFDDNGKVIRFRHFSDTAQHLAAARAG